MNLSWQKCSKLFLMGHCSVIFPMLNNVGDIPKVLVTPYWGLVIPDYSLTADLMLQRLQKPSLSNHLTNGWGPTSHLDIRTQSANTLTFSLTFCVSE